MPVPVDYRVDSTGRRVFIDLRGELQRGGAYRTILLETLTDVAQEPKSLGVAVLPFTVRKPHGDLLGGAFSLPDGAEFDAHRRSGTYPVERTRVGEGRRVVPRDGIEPPTRGFSVLCSTN